jgi:hypothetical protein
MALTLPKANLKEVVVWTNHATLGVCVSTGLSGGRIPVLEGSGGGLTGVPLAEDRTEFHMKVLCHDLIFSSHPDIYHLNARCHLLISST